MSIRISALACMALLLSACGGGGSSGGGALPGGDAPPRVAVTADRDGSAYRQEIVSPVTGDTTVVLEGRVLEKPENEAHAREMLRTLSGQTHTVASAVAVTTLAQGTRCALDLCAVTFADLSEAFIQAYVATGSPMDKAGAYGVQDVMGLVGVQRLEGSFYTVMGLPTHRLHQLLLDTH